MNKMNYKKCRDCEHANTSYGKGGGLYIICMVSGDYLEIRECPFDEEERECGNCKHEHGNCNRA